MVTHIVYYTLKVWMHRDYLSMNASDYPSVNAYWLFKCECIATFQMFLNDILPAWGVNGNMRRWRQSAQLIVVDCNW